MQNVRSQSILKQARAFLENNQLSEAKVVCDQLCRVDKANPEAWFMLGISSKGLGLLDEALAAFESAARLAPQNPFVQNERGMLLAQLGRYQEAVAAFSLALGNVPDPAAVLVSMGVVHGLMGQPEQALQALDEAVRKSPQSALAHVQRSVVLGMLSRHGEALAAAEQALRLDRHDLEAHIRYSEALLNLERYDDALAAYAACLKLAPDYLPAQQRVVEICRKATLAPSPLHDEILQRAYGWQHINFQDLAAFAASVFKARPGFLEALRAIPEENGQTFEPQLASLCKLAMEHRLYFEGPLVHGVLEDATLELATTGFRARLLHFLWAFRAQFDAGMPPEFESILNGLAQQCFNNEYLWDVTESEARLLAQVTDEAVVAWRVFSGETVSPSLALRTWMVALYQPLHAVISQAQAALASAAACSRHLKQLLKTQCSEYWEEQALKPGIAALTPLVGGVSAEVRSQYEENPYPRWQSLPVVEALSPVLALRGLFDDEPAPEWLNRPLEILIAGCGTGRHSIQTARKFPASRVTAIDLSLTSLAYAKRKTAESGIRNVDYFQADIMALGALDRRFDIIESIGVLHHLEHPLAGWRTLAGLLKSGGLMHIALYSRIAREKLKPARNYIKQAGLGNDAASIRAFRNQVLNAPEGSALAETALLGRDFYSLSNCRDLLFHVQEHQFTLEQIAAMLEELGLDFLAMEADPWTLGDYAKFNPADTSARDLAGWHRYELEHPLTFAGMYQFWCQKP